MFFTMFCSWDSIQPSTHSKPDAAVAAAEEVSLARSTKKNHCYFRKKWNLTPRCADTCDKLSACSKFMYTRPFGNNLRSMDSWDQNRQLRESHIKDWYEQPGWLLNEFRYKKGHEHREGRDTPGTMANCNLPGFV